MQKNIIGNYVRYEDYSKLRMERIHDLNQMGGQCEEIARLKAEVERLTFVDDFIVITRASIKQLIEEGVQNKSGEYEERYLIRVNKDEYIKVLKHMSEFWEAAKEGKQP